MDFNQLSFTESYIELVKIQGENIELLVQNAAIIANDVPDLSAEGSGFKVTFYGVKKSVRTLVPYAKDIFTDDFLESIDICDFDEDSDSQLNVYELEGILINPLSWIGSWLIECKSVNVSEVANLDLRSKATLL